MSIDEHHIALPKLYGSPAYARPPAPVAARPRPFDPDQLPLELYRSEGESGASHPKPRIYTQIVDIAGDPRKPDGSNDSRPAGQPDGQPRSGGLRPRSFSLRAVAGRFLGDE